MENIYSADFETNNSETECRVWAWGACNIFKPEDTFIYNNSIDSFFDYLFTFNKGAMFYFHNEKFDGQFILHWLLSHGYNICEDNKPNTFATIIDDMNKVYEIRFTFSREYYVKHKGKSLKKKKNITIKIRDSLKKINMPLKKMPKAFGLDIEKGDLDETEDEYNKIREVNHIITESELDYLRKDVIILAKSLKFLYENGLNSMTVAGGAMKMFKSMISEETFNELFPVLSFSEDEFVRCSYRGGWTYCLKEQHTGNGLVFDVNSLYPSVLYSEINGVEHLYPRGEGIYYKGKYKKSSLYPLYVQRIAVDFHIKEGYLPTIQLKNTFTSAEYCLDSNGIVELTLTNVDLDLLFKHYEIDYIKYIDGFKYKAVKGIFDEYINRFMNMKIESKEQGNVALATLAKLYLNSLYGKFGMSKIVRSKFPYLEDGVVKYKLVKYEINDELYDYLMKDGYYIPVASFCTAYARSVTIPVAQHFHELGRFCYADTDSVHITGIDFPTDDVINVDKFKLGYWDNESRFEKAIFLRAKTYAEFSFNNESNSYEWEIKCAGMPEKMKKNLLQYLEDENEELENVFKIGFDSESLGITGKLRPRNVIGGQILEEAPFKLLPKI